MARTFGADQTGRATRERILRAALELFAERGYAGTSFALVAKQVGLSAPGVLHHFPDKRALLSAVLEEYRRKDRGPDDTTSDFDDLTIPEALEVLVQTTERNLHIRDVIRLAHVIALTPGSAADVAAEWSRERLARLRADIVALEKRAQERGEIPEDIDIDSVASLVVAAFLGLEHQWLLDENFDMVAGMRVFTRLLATELRTVPAESVPTSTD